MKAIVYNFAIVSFVILGAANAPALDIDFKDGTWTHPNGTSTDGWDSSQTTGTTDLPGGATAAVSVSFHGTSAATSLNLQYIEESYFVGFAFQQNANLAENTSQLNNYMRIDIVFSSEMNLDSFVVNDVDAFEIVGVEGWLDNPGTPSSGIGAVYTPGSYLENLTFAGIASVTPTASAPEYLTLEDEAKVGIGFNTAVKAISIYHLKKVEGGASVITIGVEGNIQVSEAENTGPPNPLDCPDKRLVYTYEMNNNQNLPHQTDFRDLAPSGFVWDTSYSPQTTGGLAVNVQYSANKLEARIPDLVLPPGDSSFTLRTQEIRVSGNVDNDATLAPMKENPPNPENPTDPANWLDDQTAAAAIALPPIDPVHQFICDFRRSQICQFTWFSLGSGDITGSKAQVNGRVGVGPAATFTIGATNDGPPELYADDSATVTGATQAPIVGPLNLFQGSASWLNGAAAGLAPTQTFGTINSATVISSTTQFNVIEIDSLNLNAANDVLTITGNQDDYFIINVVSDFTVVGGGKILIDSNLHHAQVLFNAGPSLSSVTLTGTSLNLGATVLAPAASVSMGGNTLIQGSVYTGSGSNLYGSAILQGGTAFGGCDEDCCGGGGGGGTPPPASPPAVVLTEGFEGASPGMWSNGFWTYASHQDYSNSDHGALPDGGATYGALNSSGGTQASVNLADVLSTSQQADVAAGTAIWSFEAWIASWKNDSSTALLTVEWFDGLGGTGTSLGSSTVADGSSSSNVVAVVNGAALEGNSSNWDVDNWSNYSTSGAVPAGAQSLVLTFDVNSGVDGYVDDIELSISGGF